MTPNLLEGRAAIITGSGRGIGLSIASVFAENGASVVISDVNAEAAAESAAGLADKGYRVIAVPCDVTDEAQMDDLVDTCKAEFGSLDVMVNNAGITRDATIHKMSLEDFRLVIDVHMTGCWLGTRAASRVMKEQGKGSIINISSISGKVGNFGQTNYSGAKAGIVGITKAAAREVAKSGVRVNVIQPGLIETAMTAAMPPEVLSKMVAEIPMRRIGQPTDIANTALFLASDLSGFITGTVTEVAGGRHM
ncbi:3-oxoacyl-ACP reductase FabG [Phytohabitans suffuscus]|uniref:3-oxoacyl-[acyl-carrier-protein] reductase n=1 Tax=Phytohabitans suffuscus TaxID=624315 RepID=A0A6F8YRB2_9ACTN|nr:3-oxoacyl-ACP reductase FabG [Phytohabitans suffuscus]BCB88599.1 3-oxoacyl-[acyl-carrier-protein] reductase [Phytohabitans suffuscus]